MAFLAKRILSSWLVGLSVACQLGAGASVALGQEKAQPGQVGEGEVRQPAPTRPYTAVEKLRREAARLRMSVENDGTRMFLFACSWLPVVEKRTIYFTDSTRNAITREQHAALDPVTAKAYRELELDGDFYYFTQYGSPLAYARPIDIISALSPGVKNPFRGKKILDFGFGTIGHLRLLSLLGAQTVGVEVDPVLQALYSDPNDTGVIAASKSMGDDVEDGKLSLVFGRWPADPTVVANVGGEYDIIISKNVLKRGYINPEKPVEEGLKIGLGVEDAAFVEAIAKALKPGGVFLIYNIYPGQKAEKYVPWADGRCPFPRAMFESAGLEVVEFEEEDSEAIRPIGRILRWNEGETPMDLDNDTFSQYTLVRKKSS